MSGRDRLPDGYALSMAALATGWALPPILSVSEWSDQYRKIPAKSASEPGPWRTDRIPFLREIMDCLSVSSPAQRVVFMKSSQVGGTECGINWVGYFMMTVKGSMLVVQPTIDMAGKWSTQRLDASIAESESWAAVLPPRKARDRENQTLQKEGPGFILFITGANSASSLASMPIMFVFADEVDRYPDDVDDEGDPLSLALRRQKTFQRRKKTLIVSTPTIKDASRIDREYSTTDQRQYHVPCPHCGELQVLQWANLQWNAETEEVWYACAKNGCVILEHHKGHMLRELGRGGQAHWVPRYPDRPDRGYHINALYTPPGLGDTWHELVFGSEGWLAAQGNPAKLKVFMNTVLGEVWEDRTHSLKGNELKERAEAYALRRLPKGCLMLTCGVDTQDDRLEAQIIGWGRGGRKWVVDVHVIWGSPALDRVWDELSAWLDKPLENAFGLPVRISATAIDSGGHHTHDVYNFVRHNRHRRIIAVKGASSPNRPVLGRPSNVDVNWKGQTIKEGVQLWSVGADTAKSNLLGQLKADGELPVADRKTHFSHELDENYYDQLTAEAFDPSRNRWVKRQGRRNEALDTFVYAIAAAHLPGIDVHKAKESDWAYLESVLEPHTQDLFAAPASEAVAPAAPDAPRVDTSPADAGLFVEPQDPDDDGDADDYWRGR